MILIGVDAGVVVLCVSITPDQIQTTAEMYPEYLLLEQTGEESLGWLYDGLIFTRG